MLCWRVLLFFALIGCPVSLAADIPRPQNNYVNDYANLLNADNRLLFRSKLEAIENATDVELSLAIIRRKSDVAHTGTIESLARTWFDHWGVGNVPRNNGILLLMAVDDREIRIELGKAYGHDYDDAMQAIINDAMLPAFRRQDYVSGLNQGIDRLQHFATQHQRDPQALAADGKKSAPRHWIITAALGLFSVGGFWFGYHYRQRHKARNCSHCGSMMTRLSERVDDRYLDAAQKAEEKIGSVDYDVWKCTQCPHHEVTHFRQLWRRTRECPQCHRQTAVNDHSTHGHETITEHWQCRHCHHHFQRYRTVTSSNNTFGGGSSGGGGATGRW